MAQFARIIGTSFVCTILHNFPVIFKKLTSGICFLWGNQPNPILHLVTYGLYKRNGCPASWGLCKELPSFPCYPTLKNGRAVGPLHLPSRSPTARGPSSPDRSLLKPGDRYIRPLILFNSCTCLKMSFINFFHWCVLCSYCKTFSHYKRYKASFDHHVLYKSSFPDFSQTNYYISLMFILPTYLCTFT